MQRRHFLHHSGLALTAGLFGGKGFVKNILPFTDYNIRMLRNNVGVFTEKGGTIGFIFTPDGILVIDAQFPETAPHLIAELQKRNSMPIRYLLNTHHHLDHTSGNIAFKGIAEKVAAHENSLINQRTVAEKNNSLDKQLLPDTTFKGEWKIKIGSEKVRGEYYGPGHTNGDVVYYFENANIAHTGDLMFNKRHPFVDRSAGANMNNWITDLDQVLKNTNKETIFIYGHSLKAGEETGSAEDIKKFQDYLAKTLHFAESEYKKGVTKEEFIKNTSIPGVTEWEGDGIERPLTAAYEEVASGK